MKCPECIDKGLKSNVKYIPRTCMTLEMKYDHSWWDSEDLHHDHNHHSSNYECSNGHGFSHTYHCEQKDCCDKA